LEHTSKRLKKDEDSSGTSSGYPTEDSQASPWEIPPYQGYYYGSIRLPPRYRYSNLEKDPEDFDRIDGELPETNWDRLNPIIEEKRDTKGSGKHIGVIGWDCTSIQPQFPKDLLGHSHRCTLFPILSVF
jgi:hypothetical protein